MQDPCFLTTKKSRVDMLPLIDVMFLLVAFFMVAIISMVDQKGINVDLANANASSQTISDNDDTVVSITETGVFFLNKEEVTKESLTLKLNSLFSLNPKRTIYLNADKKALHQDVMESLDLVRQSGFKNVTFTVKTD